MIKLKSTEFFIDPNRPNLLFHLCYETEHALHRSFVYASSYSKYFTCNYCKIIVPRSLRFSFNLKEDKLVCKKCIDEIRII